MSGDKGEKKTKKRHFSELEIPVSQGISLERIVNEPDIHDAYRHILGYGVAVEFGDEPQAVFKLPESLTTSISNYMSKKKHHSTLSKALMSVVDDTNKVATDAKMDINAQLCVMVADGNLIDNKFFMEVPGIGITSTSVDALFCAKGKKGVQIQPPAHRGPTMFDCAYLAMDFYSSESFQSDFKYIMNVSLAKSVMMVYSAAKYVPLLVTDGSTNYYKFTVSRMYKGTIGTIGTPIVSIHRPNDPAIVQDIHQYVTKPSCPNSVKKIAILAWMDNWVYSTSHRKRFMVSPKVAPDQLDGEISNTPRVTPVETKTKEGATPRTPAKKKVPSATPETSVPGSNIIRAIDEIVAPKFPAMPSSSSSFEDEHSDRVQEVIKEGYTFQDSTAKEYEAAVSRIKEKEVEKADATELAKNRRENTEKDQIEEDPLSLGGEEKGHSESSDEEKKKKKRKSKKSKKKKDKEGGKEDA